MKFTADQQKVLDIFVEFLATKNEKFMVIQGASGCGKSTLIKHLALVAEKHKAMSALLLQKDKADVGFNLVLAATTNPAVAVLENLTGYKAKTVHSKFMLTIKNNFKTGEKDTILRKNAEPIKDSLIIIDEASMIDEELFNFIDQQTHNCKIVLIGDQYQLAPVNRTTTVMETLECTRAVMNTIMRNSGSILITGQQFRNTVETGKFLPIPKGHSALEQVDGATFQMEIEKTYTARGYNPQSTKIITWTNKRVQAYNNHIRTIKNKPKGVELGETVLTNKPIISQGYYKSVDSAVTITQICDPIAEVYGVTGRIIEIGNKFTAFLPDDPADETKVLNKLKKEKNWKAFFHVKDNWLDLRLPYACTIHKAQGDQYDTVFIDLVNIGSCQVPSDVARMLYVGISRAKKKVYLYGNLPKHYGGIR